MQPFLALASVTHTFIQLLSWFGWAVIALVIVAVLATVLLTIRQSWFVQQFITKILKSGSSQDQTTNNSSNYTQYTTGSNSSAGEGYTPTQKSSNEATDDAGAGVESISEANTVGVSDAGATDGTTPEKRYDNNIGEYGDSMSSDGVESSFEARDSDASSQYGAHGGVESGIDGGGTEEGSVTVKEPDHDFTSDDVESGGTSPPVDGDFGSQFAADQVTGSLTGVQGSDVFDSSMDSMSDFDDVSTDISSTPPTDYE